MGETLLILGASVRAAAQSARAAGFSVTAGDLFADADLVACADARRCRRYPCDLPAIAKDAPPGPWLYTGGLENYPAVVDRITRDRPLFGNPGDVLRRVRDPVLLARTLQSAGLPTAEVRATPDDLPRDGSWLCKPRRGSGGLLIGGEESRGEGSRGEGSRKGWFWQRYVPGMACSAAFVAAGGRAVMLGTTEQLIGDWQSRDPSAPPTDFRYAGSIADPTPFPPTPGPPFPDLGNFIAREFRLVGLFGIDAIWTGEHLVPIEVNPRYTASLEVIEAVTGTNAIRAHVDACVDGRLPSAGDDSSPSDVHSAGKAIWYAEQEVVVDAAFHEQVAAINAGHDWPPLCDIPARDSKIPRDAPVLTIRTRGATRDEVRESLTKLLREIPRQLTAGK